MTEGLATFTQAAAATLERRIRDARGISNTRPPADKRPPVQPNELWVGKVDSWTGTGPTSSGTVSLYTGEGGSEADTTDNVTAYGWIFDTGESPSASDNVILAPCGSDFYVLAVIGQTTGGGGGGGITKRFVEFKIAGALHKHEAEKEVIVMYSWGGADVHDPAATTDEDRPRLVVKNRRDYRESEGSDNAYIFLGEPNSTGQAIEDTDDNVWWIDWVDCPSQPITPDDNYLDLGNFNTNPAALDVPADA